MLFDWWKKTSRRPGDEWPQFTDNLMSPLMSAPQLRTQSPARLALDDARFDPKAEEEIIAAARLVY